MCPPLHLVQGEHPGHPTVEQSWDQPSTSRSRWALGENLEAGAFPSLPMSPRPGQQELTGKHSPVAEVSVTWPDVQETPDHEGRGNLSASVSTSIKWDNHALVLGLHMSIPGKLQDASMCRVITVTL